MSTVISSINKKNKKNCLFFHVSVVVMMFVSYMFCRIVELNNLQRRQYLSFSTNCKLLHKRNIQNPHHRRPVSADSTVQVEVRLYSPLKFICFVLSFELLIKSVCNKIIVCHNTFHNILC